MAGSMRWFLYTANDGVSQFAIYADESNTRAVNATAPAPAAANIYAIPRNLQPRYVTYKSADGNITRKCYALTTAALEASPVQFDDPVSGLTLGRANLRGENIRLPSTVDTGLTDGTQP